MTRRVTGNLQLTNVVNDPTGCLDIPVAASFANPGVANADYVVFVSARPASSTQVVGKRHIDSIYFKLMLLPVILDFLEEEDLINHEPDLLTYVVLFRI